MAAAACPGEDRGGQDDKGESFDNIHNCHPGIYCRDPWRNLLDASVTAALQTPLTLAA